MAEHSVAAICIAWRNEAREEVALIKRRSDHHHQLAGRWFFPGGIVEVGEQPIDAAVRETEEECHLKVINPELVDAYTYTELWQDAEGVDRQLRIMLAAYQSVCTNDVEIAISDECEDVAWVPVSEIGSYISQETVASHLSQKVMELFDV